MIITSIVVIIFINNAPNSSIYEQNFIFNQLNFVL